MHLRRAVAPAVGLLVAACAESSTTPTAVRVPLSASHDAVATPAALSGRYLVAFNGTAALGRITTTARQLGGTVEFSHQGAGIALVSGLTDSSAAQISAISGVADVQPDTVVSLDEPVPAVEADISSVTDPGIASQTNPTLASRYGWQWNMRLIGADKAWAAGELGDPGVTVAILDTGLDYDDPDLKGLVDLSRSTSFVASDDQITATYFPSRNPISDYNGHGTNVAQQVSSNGRALAGVTSRTRIIGVKVLGASGSGLLSGILNGVLWAADHGADVANMSLGGAFSKAGNGRTLAFTNRVFNYAKQKGMLIVVAAGNNGADLDHVGNAFVAYCAAPHVVCVSSVGPALANGSLDDPAYYTNFGRSAIDVAAPGGNADAADNFQTSAWPWGTDIASWVWSYCSKTLIAGYTKAGVPILTACTAGNRLLGYIGTSQATPHVAGLAALLVANTGHGHPDQIKHLIESSADDLGQPGTDPYYGKGLIDVARALGLQ